MESLAGESEAGKVALEGVGHVDAMKRGAGPSRKYEAAHGHHGLPGPMGDQGVNHLAGDRSNAGLLTTVGMIGWRDQYVSELRRRMLRLNEIQTER